MAEDKQLQAGLMDFLNKKPTSKAPRQKVVEKAKTTKTEILPKKEKAKTKIQKAAKETPKEAPEAPETPTEDVFVKKTGITTKEDKKPSNGLKGPVAPQSEMGRKNPGPKSHKKEGIDYKQISARVPEILKDKLKQSLHLELFKQYTQDEFIEQAIIDLLKKHGIKVPKY